MQASMEEEGGRLATFCFYILAVLCAVVTCSTAANDTISANQTIKDGETIVSAYQNFRLGFFTLDNSTNRRYVGIGYKNFSSANVMWVANRNTPLIDTSGELSLTLQGILVLRNATGDVIWSSANSSSSNSSSSLARKPMARLLNAGSFIVSTDYETYYDEDPIWQSFDFPTDTVFAGMKLGKDLERGVETHLTSWKSEEDPSVGQYSVWIDTKGYPQMVVRNGTRISFRVGPWNGIWFSGEPILISSPDYEYDFVFDEGGIYYYIDPSNTPAFTRLTIWPDGNLEMLLWLGSIMQWDGYSFQYDDFCDSYAICGSFAICHVTNSPSCVCLEGFEPTSPDQWNIQNWSQGCRPSTPSDCWRGFEFRRYSKAKLPDTQGSWFDPSMDIDECEKVCKKNCSCTAYATQDIDKASGCLLWFGELMDMRTVPESGQEIYIKTPTSELENTIPAENIIPAAENTLLATNGKSSRRRVEIIVPVILILFFILLSVCLFYRYKRRKPKQEATLDEDFELNPINNSKDDLELPFFGFSVLRRATNNFSDNNKLGRGGFGPVYKGVLENGQEVAVKRLSRTSTQGLTEFKNEVIFISKLQHRNLVKLLGCCIKGAEKMLVYEYMPNKSLDSFLHDETQSKVLDWRMRFRIINGIVKGLLYLHRDSRLRIIHRDLKISNILLDHDMNPKISNFGLARSFEGNQIEANTNKVVGTYGYMAPEYAGDGIFSIKSDVFSFGVMVLEIVSGKKNRGFFCKEHNNNLLGHAWGLHREGRSMELVAESLDESVILSEAVRSIHVGLLCVQQRPEDRPTMTSVILMLGSEDALPPPKAPGFFNEKDTTDTDCSSSSHGKSSINELTISMLNPR